jgi:hypothetical protein
MKKTLLISLVITVVMTTVGIKWAISDSQKTERERRALVDTRIDNNGYWKKMAEQGLAVLNPAREVEPAVFTGSKIHAYSVITDDSPDVPVTDESGTQSENSIFVDPSDKLTALNSNNSVSGGGALYGADDLYTFDGAETFEGEIQGAGGSNSGDPTTGIDNNGRWYVNFISSSGGQAVAYSDNQGGSWTSVYVASNPGNMADKNHMWVDNSPDSPYDGNLYIAWTDFGGSNDGDIVISRSTNAGESWSSKINISNGINAGSHNQGVNISTGPNGEIYAIWAIYDSWPSDEDAIGMAKSTDGGETWDDPVRIITNIRGVRNSGVPQNMRVASFPAAAVDCSDGPNRGNIYVVWTNIGVPGENTGSDRDVYMIRSINEGSTWSDPIRINQDEIGQGKAHYDPWIACDPANGILSVIFYDNRNVNSNQAEAWAAVSTNAGSNWEDFKVSDVSFTPSPIPGLASGYFGDYLGITAYDGKVYPCWTDNRTGSAMTYVSVFETINIQIPYDLEVAIDDESGQADLTWNFNVTDGFEYFNVYRNGELLGNTNDEFFTDQLPEYGYYTYEVKSFYGDAGESAPATVNTQWGSASIEAVPNEVTAVLYQDETAIKQIKLYNNGELELEFELAPFFNKSSLPHYQAAKGGGDEYISNVVFQSIHNSSGWKAYSDYTGYVTTIKSNSSYEISVYNGNAYEGDQCAVWVDWNRNGVFDESAVRLNWDGSKFTGTISPVKGAAQGATGMRIRLAGPGTLSAYGDTEYGETEDYTLLIADWLSLDPESGTVPIGEFLTLNLTFDATDMDLGTYTDNLRLMTNDIDNSYYTIPVTMHITDMTVTAEAAPADLCQGDATQLSAEASGGSGSFTYQWTSLPEGFNSTEQNPEATPDTDIKYVVAVNDGTIVMTDTVEVIVHALPDVDLGDDQVLCGDNEYELDAGNEGAAYLWSTGETTQTITASGEGVNSFWVEVTNDNDCSARDTIVLNFAAVPVVELGNDTTICNNAVLTLDAGNPDAAYLWSTGETTQTIIINADEYEYGTHTFSVDVTSTAGCESSDEINVEIKDCTSIDENEQTVKLTVFPNPSNGVFSLQLNTLNTQTVTIRVTDLTGKTVYRSEEIKVSGTYSQRIDLTQLSGGVYNVFVIGDNGVAEKKVVIR